MALGVGEHSVSVTLDGALLPKCPVSVVVAPEDICLAACQIQGSGTHRASAGERASFVVEAHDARGNRLTIGNAPLSVVVRTVSPAAGVGAITQGQARGRGASVRPFVYSLRFHSRHDPKRGGRRVPAQYTTEVIHSVCLFIRDCLIVEHPGRDGAF